MSDQDETGHWVTRGTIQVWEGPLPRRGVRPPAQCGTDGGYYRHLRITKTPTCKACRQAHAQAEYERRTRRGVA